MSFLFRANAERVGHFNRFGVRSLGDRPDEFNGPSTMGELERV